MGWLAVARNGGSCSPSCHGGRTAGHGGPCARSWQIPTTSDREGTGGDSSHQWIGEAGVFRLGEAEAAADCPREPLPLPEWGAPGRVGRFDKYSALVVCSANGRLVLSLGKDYVPCLWDLGNGKELTRFVGHVGLVTSLAFSPDARRVLSGGHDGSVRLWDAATGQMIRRFEGHTVVVYSVAYSADGRFALSGGGAIVEKDGKREPTDLSVRLWDVDTGRQVRRFDGHAHVVTSVAFAPDGRHVATASMDETVRLWDVDNGQEVQRFLGHSAAVTCVAYAPNGKHVLSASRDNTMRLWDVTTGKVVQTFKGNEKNAHAWRFQRTDGASCLAGRTRPSDCGTLTAAGRLIASRGTKPG